MQQSRHSAPLLDNNKGDIAQYDLSCALNGTHMKGYAFGCKR